MKLASQTQPPLHPACCAGMATLKPLLVLKAPVLRSLAVSLGVNSGGTKSDIASRIVSACCESVPFFERSPGNLQQDRRGVRGGGAKHETLKTRKRGGKSTEERRGKRILSIDMGIRNLAMCILEIPYSPREVGAKGRRGKKVDVTEDLPKVLAWERLAIAERPVDEHPSTAPLADNADSDKTGGKGGEAKKTQPEEPPPVPLGGEEVPDQGRLGGKKGRKGAKVQSEEAPSGGGILVLGELEKGERKRRSRKIQPGEPLPALLKEKAPVLEQARGNGGRTDANEVQSGKLLSTPPEEAPVSEGAGKKKRRMKKFLFEEAEFILSNPYSAPDLELDSGVEVIEMKESKPKRAKRAKKKSESFEPSVYAALADTFVRRTLARFSPLDAILIERQRYRSNGAPAIQEWTVRVNMFESMLHAVFYCLRGEASPIAESVSPNRVTRFWVDRVEAKHLEVKGGKPRAGKEVQEMIFGSELGLVFVGREKTYRKTKLAKISVVTEWLQRGDVVSLGEEVKDMAANFAPPVKGKRKAKSNGEKLDDLADCLLQGMAWIRWEKNRKKFAEGKLIPEFGPCVNSKS